MAWIMAITENDIPTAAVHCVLIFPTKKVSAILYRLVTSILIIVGTAIVSTTLCTGAWVKKTKLSCLLSMTAAKLLHFSFF